MPRSGFSQKCLIKVFTFFKCSTLASVIKPARCETVYDSNADFAQIIKSVVDDKVQEGMSEKEIYNFLSEKYGDWILFDPPFKKSSYVLWFLPYVLFVMGMLFLFYLFKRSSIRRK